LRIRVMDERTVWRDFRRVFRDVFQREVTLLPNTTASDVVGWDSFKHVKLLTALEDHFRIEFHIDEINSAGSVGDLVKIISEKVGMTESDPGQRHDGA